MKKIIILFLFLAALLTIIYPHLIDPQKVDLKRVDGEVIDVHTHIAGLGYGDSGCFVGKKLTENFRFPAYLYAFGVSKEDIATYGDAILVERLAKKIKASRYIDKAVILALDGKLDEQGELDRENTEIYVPNDYVAKETAKYKELLFGASINPYRKDSIERLEQVKKDGAVLVKWIPCIMGIDPADEKIIPFYQKLIELNIPLLSHAGRERAFSSAEDKLCDPLRLELPLKLGVTVILAHIATTGDSEGEDNFLRAMPLFEKYPNLYADISSLTQINKRRYLARALQNPHVRQQLIYGSDWPLQIFPIISPFYHLETISIRNAILANSFKNQWDRDFVLKRAIGVDDQIFARTAEVLGRE